MNYEIIVINDGSTDNVLGILEENKNLYTMLISNSLNKGKGFAVREGIKNATGDYIIFQNADLEINKRMDGRPTYDLHWKPINY